MQNRIVSTFDKQKKPNFITALNKKERVPKSNFRKKLERLLVEREQLAELRIDFSRDSKSEIHSKSHIRGRTPDSIRASMSLSRNRTFDHSQLKKSTYTECNTSGTRKRQAAITTTNEKTPTHEHIGESEFHTINRTEASESSPIKRLEGVLYHQKSQLLNYQLKKNQLGTPRRNLTVTNPAYIIINGYPSSSPDSKPERFNNRASSLQNSSDRGKTKIITQDLQRKIRILDKQKTDKVNSYFNMKRSINNNMNKSFSIRESINRNFKTPNSSAMDNLKKKLFNKKKDSFSTSNMTPS